mmetsp:Transcript_19181/g.18523  ORF Transcript_19181/g.18523 Transcript_19181/m.18523 type:complete len:219 (-) Transcript_19181:84-740(-)
MLFWSKIALFLTYIIIEIVASSVKTSAGESVCTYRLATRLDIPNIAACNVKSLPENYTPEYYRRTLGTWPNLAVIAENDQQKLIGYALGRIEILDPQPRLVPGAPVIGANGHVSSIAVLETYRGQGIAKNLMRLLHSQFISVYNAKSVSLHCRMSNTAATHLYLNTYGYRCVGEVPDYYEDGESAWLMRLDNLKGWRVKYILGLVSDFFYGLGRTKQK